MNGTLSSGLVLSNAFKNENVYKIVLPRGQISYYNIDELIEDNVTVYSRIQSFNYRQIIFVRCRYFSSTYIRKFSFQICKDNSWWLYGDAELAYQGEGAFVLPETE